MLGQIDQARGDLYGIKGSSGYPGPTRAAAYTWVTGGDGAADAAYLLKGPLAYR